MMFGRYTFGAGFLTLLLSLEKIQHAFAEEKSCESDPKSIPPYTTARVLVMDKVKDLGDESEEYALSDVYGCCESSKNEETNETTFSQANIGKMPQFTEDQGLEVLKVAKKAWNGGSGTWPQMSLQQRLEAIENFLNEVQKSREEIVHTLMWEIGKNKPDAESEFDRTMQFARKAIAIVRSSSEYSSGWQTIGSVKAFVRRAAIGIFVALGPYNYPLNETYATIIPALLMGNIIILKVPTVGGLAHLYTMEAFTKTLPPGVVTMISGSARKTIPPVMQTGDVDGLAFIGGSNAADDLIRKHPNPHRLKVFLQLEANNMGIYLPDLFLPENSDALDRAMKETMKGTLSFNGQRCTALKLLMVPEDKAEDFSIDLAKRVESLSVGLPWDLHDGAYSKITPLPFARRVEYMKSLIDDAVSKGAKIFNKDGGTVIGGKESTLMVPAVLYPVTPDMEVYHAEQFGPIVPVTSYTSLDKIVEFGRDGDYGQQCSIFTASQDEETSKLVDQFSTVFGKININAQCGRSPDTLPFSGRRSSAMGVMSVSDALKEFSVPTVVSYVDGTVSDSLIDGIKQKSSFLQDLE